MEQNFSVQDAATAYNVTERRQVLTKAVVRASERLALTQSQLGQILGVSRPSISRMLAGHYLLQAGRAKEWELGGLFVRLYRALLAIVGDDAAAKVWLRGANDDLGATPLELVVSAEGLIRLVQYLDAHRGVV
jgi:transcriptional regulator with XRE-family HTH domain